MRATRSGKAKLAVGSTVIYLEEPLPDEREFKFVITPMTHFFSWDLTRTSVVVRNASTIPFYITWKIIHKRDRPTWRYK